MKSRSPRRRHPLAGVAVLLVALVATGVGFAFVSGGTQAQAADGTVSADDVAAGKQLYLEGCSSCHGLGAQGSAEYPSLINVGAAAVDFQVSTGRMPAAANAEQIIRKPPIYTEEQTRQIAAYIATLGAGPAIPAPEQVDTTNADLTEGGVLFRTNCQQCHNFAGAGGALSNGAFAPSLMNATPTQIWEAMMTGPQQMPVFSQGSLSDDSKKDIIKFVEHLQTAQAPGGLALGSYGPVTEGIFIWIAGLGALLGVAVWIGAKVR